jgi:hypothetical protein
MIGAFPKLNPALALIGLHIIPSVQLRPARSVRLGLLGMLEVGKMRDERIIVASDRDMRIALPHTWILTCELT